MFAQILSHTAAISFDITIAFAYHRTACPSTRARNLKNWGHTLVSKIKGYVILWYIRVISYILVTQLILYFTCLNMF